MLGSIIGQPHSQKYARPSVLDRSNKNVSKTLSFDGTFLQGKTKESCQPVKHC